MGGEKEAQRMLKEEEGSALKITKQEQTEF